MDTQRRIKGSDSARLNDTDFKDALLMMVDDEPIMMELVQAFLEDEGYQRFISVEDPREAMAVLEKRRPDILLLDLVMPEISGFEILSQIRQHQEFAYLPVIVLTSSSDAPTKLKALELGATDFLAKPVDASELILRLRNTLALKAYLDQLAYYDGLTQLPNRKLFIDRLGWALQSAAVIAKQVAVLSIALDRFGQINESFGVQVGDRVLQAVTERIQEVVQSEEVVSSEDNSQCLARLGGDEFTALLPVLERPEEAAAIARKIINNLHHPFEINGQQLFVTASIGISLSPDDGHYPEQLIQSASSAMRHAKEQGKDLYRFYSSTINEQSRKRLALEGDLRQALANHQLELHYQPKVDIHTHQTIGMETLIRWVHPQKGMIPPDQFVPLAEELGLIVPIGSWILQQACLQTAQWTRAGLGALKVCVNVSGQQFKESDFPSRVTEALQQSGLQPQQLVIEITESMAMQDVQATIKVLKAIKQLGVGLSIDDFGTGYSSLSYLKRFPIDELKVDRAFIMEVPDNQDEVLIVQAIIAMAKALQLGVVVEGVETQEQLDFLKTTDSDVIQGYYFSKPLPAEAFREYVHQSLGNTPEP
ncbi:putative bifunctional diguanylate cyclase/phosphodiesterase [Dongshaea marina]|uniref:putative bifunctional diguanylate cyclase/phosphodiesterase n=1 Tax=Dongshaea marina TaxID=2047966 RepID=UPI000D3EB19C|nr:EAL domain-containing protein [Dongshaea marina]